MRILISILSLSVGSLAFGGGGPEIPFAPKKDAPKITSKEDDCPPLPECPKPTPKPKPKPKPKPAPVKPQPCPAVKCPDVKCPDVKCPDVKCAPCNPKVIEKEKVVEKVIEKPKYIDRTVTIDNAPKNTFNILIGVGPHGLMTDSYQTEDRKDEYAVRKERDRSTGGVIGIQYQYRFTPSMNANGLIISNQTVMGGIGFSW